jgi:oligopeptide transport system substrate-binding protein
MWRRTSLGVITSLALVLAACGGGTTTPSPGASVPPASEGPAVDPEGRFRYPGGAQDPPTLDPNLASDSASLLVLMSVQRPLLWINPDLELTPDGGLAEALPEVTDDGATLTFTLKEGIAFSNGDPITAADFVYGWRRTIDPRVAAPYSYVMLDVVGAQELYDMAGLDELPPDEEIEAALENFGVEAPDDSTFVVHLGKPATYFQSIASLWVTVPVQQSWVEIGDDFTEAENYVSSGPFMVTEWVHDASITLEPNPNWYGEAPKVAAIDISLGGDPDADYRAYLNDEIDISAVPGANAEQVRNDPDLSQQAITGDVLCTYYLGFDMDPDDGDTSPVENKNLRHAISRAIDKEGLIATVRQGIGKPADSFVPVGMPGHQDYGFGLTYDVDAAQELLNTALEELGIASAADINLVLGVNADAGHEPIMEFVQANLQDNLGLTVEVEALEWSVYLDTIAENPQDMYRLGWCQDYPHPNNFLYEVWGCGIARGGYCNEDYNDLLLEAQTIADLGEQLPIYEEAQAMLVEDAPAVWVYWYGRFTLVKPWVQGLVVTAGDSNAGDLFFDQVSILEHD